MPFRHPARVLTAVVDTLTSDDRKWNTPVESVYARLAPIYDVMYGVVLRPGRSCAVQRLAPRVGERILEIGAGTGLSALQYPRGCQVVAIDVSMPMLLRARARLARRGIRHVHLMRMDAAQLAFPPASFDAAYAPYVINVVADPVQVAREMVRVVRPGGRLVFLNHFRHTGAEEGLLDRCLGRVAVVAGGASWNLDLQALMDHAGLEPVSVETVNVPRVSSVVVCRRP